MRVITGRWKGRRLLGPRGHEVRPTTDRVKEAMFNLLGDRVAGSLVIDLCCGSGSLGVEALSRGARRVIFVDTAPAALDLVRRNLAHCGAPPASWSLVRRDAARFLDDLPRSCGPGAWILLCDPPYASPLGDVLLERGRELGELPGFTAAVVETGAGRRGEIEETGPWDYRRYGRTRLAVLRPPTEGAADE